jgi:hypothetical protein
MLAHHGGSYQQDIGTHREHCGKSLDVVDCTPLILVTVASTVKGHCHHCHCHHHLAPPLMIYDDHHLATTTTKSLTHNHHHPPLTTTHHSPSPPPASRSTEMLPHKSLMATADCLLVPRHDCLPTTPHSSSRRFLTTCSCQGLGRHFKCSRCVCVCVCVLAIALPLSLSRRIHNSHTAPAVR